MIGRSHNYGVDVAAVEQLAEVFVFLDFFLAHCSSALAKRAIHIANGNRRHVGLAEEGPASQKSLSEELVDAFNAVYGVHPGVRANHAKGVVLEGVFTPTASAASLSKAAHLKKQKKAVPVTVRFSDGSGLSTVADTEEMPRGIAVKFHLPDKSSTDIVLLSVNGFPVSTAEEFRDFLLAISASGPDAPKPTAFDNFLSAHPAATAFVQAPKPPPVSYATLPYFGLNAFKFTNAKGVSTLGRYQLRPVAGEKFLTKELVATKGPKLSDR